MSSNKNIQNRLSRWADKARRAWNYCSGGVWSDRSNSLSVKIIKTINLSTITFLNRDVQTTATAMAFRTLLATVPALAMLYAVGRGFNLTSVISDALVKAFPAQRTAIDHGLNYVDSYLNQASEGAFVGIGLIFLLYTLISLIQSAEEAFDKVWGVVPRSPWRMITDYTAILILLPVLLICSTGINVMMSSTLKTLLPSDFMSPFVTAIIDAAGFVFVWLFFTGVYMLLPNAKVKFVNALMSGFIAGVFYTALQWLFVSGQIYVSKYNAIYGTVAFLPLTMVWMQLVWMGTLLGAVVCYSAQNIFQYDNSVEIGSISLNYRRQILLAVMTIIVHDEIEDRPAPTIEHICRRYSFPFKLLSQILDELIRTHLVELTLIDPKKQIFGYRPCGNPNTISAGDVLRTIRSTGNSGFISGFNTRFAKLIALFNKFSDDYYEHADQVMLASIEINSTKLNSKPQS